MKRFLLAASLAALLPAAVLAQSAATPNAKADPKKSGASRPVEDKSRRLTRDELRACMLLSDANKAESIGVRDAQAAYFKERADLLDAKEKLKKQSDWLDEEGSVERQRRRQQRGHARVERPHRSPSGEGRGVEGRLQQPLVRRDGRGGHPQGNGQEAVGRARSSGALATATVRGGWHRSCLMERT
jgi:opacity protein-like surface antigen